MDWCAAVDGVPVPAEPEQLARFIAANPAATATQRRRIAVINAAHRRAGHRPPGIAEVVREHVDAARAARRRQLTAIAADVVEHLPTEGWPVELFALRDSLLLVLATSGIRPTALARLCVGDVFVDDVADQLHIAPDGAEAFATDPALVELGVSPSAVLEQWLPLRALQHHVPSPSVTAAALRGAPTPRVPAAPDEAPLFVPLDGWGVPPVDTSVHLSGPIAAAVLRAHLTGGAPAHRRIAQRPAPPSPAPVALELPEPVPLDPASWDRGVAARRAAQAALADVDEVLDAVEAEAARRLEDLLRILDEEKSRD